MYTLRAFLILVEGMNLMFIVEDPQTTMNIKMQDRNKSPVS